MIDPSNQSYAYLILFHIHSQLRRMTNGKNPMIDTKLGEQTYKTMMLKRILAALGVFWRVSYIEIHCRPMPPISAPLNCFSLLCIQPHSVAMILPSSSRAILVIKSIRLKRAWRERARPSATLWGVRSRLI